MFPELMAGTDSHRGNNGGPAQATSKARNSHKCEYNNEENIPKTWTWDSRHKKQSQMAKM